MYVVNGIAYVGESDPVLEVNGVRPMNDFKLCDEVYIDYGVPVRNDGDIDISPETLYENGVKA
jgi:hypothetical protein